VLGVQRRKDIYALCSKYDILICEDDPYWYLQFPLNGKSNSMNYNTANGGRSSGYPFLDSLVPSYLSVDYEGRVIRMDTFSKTVAPGCRLGWITAQPALIERILRITETSTQQPSGFVQAMIAELIMGPPDGPKNGNGSGGAKDGRGWRFDGWVRWLEGLRGEYQRRMEEMASILLSGNTIMKSGRRASLSGLITELDLTEVDADEWSVIEKTKIYDFVRPLGGMFLWVRFNFSTHPLSKQIPGARLSQALWVYFTTEPYKVLVAPGQMFAPTQEVLEHDAWECFRLCFAAAETDEISDFSKRFVKGAKGFWRIKDADKIDELLKDIEHGEEAATLTQQDGIRSLMGFC
jgi:DNA-binding transcriptional MocR family regulator